MQNLAGKAFDQRADLQGTVTATSRPTIAPNWRLAPNLSGQVNVADVALPIAGIKLSVAAAVKPALDAAVREQIGALESRLRRSVHRDRGVRRSTRPIRSCASPMSRSTCSRRRRSGAAAQAALPYLQKMLAEKAAIDLKPFAADAKKRIAAAVIGFARQDSGMSATVAIDDLRLVGVAYDAKTLRVIANAAGTASVAISKLAMR